MAAYILQDADFGNWRQSIAVWDHLNQQKDHMKYHQCNGTSLFFIILVIFFLLSWFYPEENHEDYLFIEHFIGENGRMVILLNSDTNILLSMKTLWRMIIQWRHEEWLRKPFKNDIDLEANPEESGSIYKS